MVLPSWGWTNAAWNKGFQYAYNTDNEYTELAADFEGYLALLNPSVTTSAAPNPQENTPGELGGKILKAFVPMVAAVYVIVAVKRLKPNLDGTIEAIVVGLVVYLFGVYLVNLL